MEGANPLLFRSESERASSVFRLFTLEVLRSLVELELSLRPGLLSGPRCESSVDKPCKQRVRCDTPPPKNNKKHTTIIRKC